MRNPLPTDPQRLKRLLEAASRALPQRAHIGEDTYEKTGGVYVRSNMQKERTRAANRLAQARERIGETSQALFNLAHELYQFAAAHEPEAAPKFLPPYATQTITKAELRKTNKWWVGKELVLKRSVRTWQASIEPGRRVTVTRKFKGFEIRTPFCGHCGTAFHATQVPAHYFAWPPDSKTRTDPQ